MKVLVTGGCGFIGSHVVDIFIENGHKVAIIDNLSTGKMENRNGDASFYEMDICDDSVEEVFRSEKPDIISHHAAQISVPFSVEEPLLDAEVNIKGTIRLLEMARKFEVKKFIFASTGGAIYGEAKQIPTDEGYVPEPESPYAISKLSSEKYIRFYHSLHGIDYTVLRYSNVYGPRQIPNGEAGVVSIFMEALLAGKHPAVNSFPDEPEGMVRDYCFVGDIAIANLIASSVRNPSIFNIGTGKGTRTLELYTMIYDVLSREGVEMPRSYMEPKKGVARPGDIRVSTLDATKAKDALRWEPQYDLRKGLEETAKWYRKK